MFAWLGKQMVAYKPSETEGIVSSQRSEVGYQSKQMVAEVKDPGPNSDGVQVILAT